MLNKERKHMMKRMLFAGALLAAAALSAGSWTQDFEAAKKESKERNLPMMLDFTGSDWCGWCVLMDKKVFAEKAWDEWAATNLVCVTVDFPNDESKITSKTRGQNEELLKRFGVRGFPTFVMLSPGGGKEIGRTGCPGRNVTPGMFIDAVKGVLKKSAPAAK